jgi:membrane-associated protein
VLDSFKEYVSDSVWTYPYLFGVSALDVVFPLVPSETSVILAGVLAGTGDLEIVAVILVAAAGAVVGDNTSYWIGRTAGPWIVSRFFRGERKKRIDWAGTQIEERGPYLIVVGRFIPGGRTAITLAAGLLQMRWRKFIVFDVAAGLCWATYAGLLGYFGGRVFEEEPLQGFLIAFAIALAVTGAVEVYRWLKRRNVAASG